MLRVMASAEVTTASKSSVGVSVSSDVRKEFTIKQGVTICSSSVLISDVPQSDKIPFLDTK